MDPNPVVIEPELSSWVEGADESGWPIQHLPYGVFSVGGQEPRIGVGIGHHVLDLKRLAGAGVWDIRVPKQVLDAPILNPLLSSGRTAWTELRRGLVDLLRADATTRPPDDAFHDLDDVTVHLPFDVADYVDFYSSLHHAQNVGRLFRPQNPLLPNWRHLPVAYHGRAGTVVVSGTPIRRPAGQLGAPAGPGPPEVGPTRRLDFELEVGVVSGVPEPRSGLTPADVPEVVFGVVLVDDWSARDIQGWEYEPLGPFLGKSFATSIAGWVTPLDAVLPFRVPAPAQDPEPAEYLRVEGDWALDLDLTVEIRPDGSEEPSIVTRTSFRDLYWTFPQQLAHATVNGATVRTGDLYASGTVSGPERGTEGCLLERTRGGQEPVTLADGTQRTFLEDGDEVTLRGSARYAQGPRIELAPVTGRIVAAEDEGHP